MRAYPYLIGLLLIFICYMIWMSRINEYYDWNQEHLRETGKNYKEMSIE
jgi:hypothetical protein